MVGPKAVPLGQALKGYIMMKTVILATAFGMAAAAASAATISIDDFSTAQGPVTATPGTTVSDTQAVPSGALGDRTLTATGLGSSSQNTSGFITGPAVNALGVSNDFFSQGVVEVSYDLAGFDLGDGGTNDTILIGVQAIDLNALFSVSVNGVSSSSGVTNAGALNFSFSDFAGVDFSSVDTLSFSVDSNGTDAVDSVFTFIGVDDLVANPVATVPLPAGAPLLLGALGLMGWVRRKS